MKHIKKAVVSLAMLSLLAACGGGEEDIGNNIALNVTPSETTHLSETCPGGFVVDRPSIYIINGGFGPFRVGSTSPGIQVGFASGTNFVAANPGSFNSEGFLLVDGQEPRFAVLASAACGSEAIVAIFDSRSTRISVSIKVEAPAE